MDILTRDDIRELVMSTDDPCVSIYLTVHPHTSESRGDGLRIQHLLDDAERQLAGRGLRTSEARDFLLDMRSSPGHNLVRENHSEGLAILKSTSVQRTYRLPEAFAERVVGGSWRQSAVFHGGGGRADANRTELELYCHDVAAAVTGALNGRTEPLIVVAVDSLQANFAAECTGTQRVPVGVSGSPDKWNETELHSRVLAAAAPALDERRRGLLKRVRASLGTAAAATQISEILRAAAQGRVSLLVFDRGADIRGTFDPDNLNTELHLTPQAGDDDLTDLALHLTMAHAGEVITAEPGELPAGCEAVALLRY